MTMTDEQDNEMTDEQQPEETQAEQAAPEPVAEPEQTPEPVAQDTPKPEPVAPEPVAEAEQAAPEPVAEPEQASKPVAKAPPEPVEQLSPKERRSKVRSLHVGPAHPSRSPEERQAERDAVRRTKAVKRRARRLQERAKRVEHRASTPAAQPLAPVHPRREGAGRMRQGVVVSNKADKTITVRIDVARRHRRYEKIVRSSSTLHAHDENNDAHEGDVVRVIESRPLSRTKRWRLVDVLERAR